MRILVCGGRDYDPRKAFRQLMCWDNHDQKHTIIHGMATGADTGAMMWAIFKFYEELSFPANWIAYGKAAGYKRNIQMLEEGKPEIILCLPGGKGTANMVALANASKIPIQYL